MEIPKHPKRYIKQFCPPKLWGAWAYLNRRYFQKIVPPDCFAVELTSYCNLRCAMCPYDQIKRQKGNMNIATFKKIVDQSEEFKYPIHWFHFFGETLLYPFLEESLVYFHKKGFGPGGISTNGLLLDEKKIELIVKYCKLVRVSIDSLNEDVYRTLRNNDQLDLVCENIRRLIEMARHSDLKIEIQWLRTRLNRDEGLDAFREKFGQVDNVVFFQKDAIQYGGSARDFRVASQKSDVRYCSMPFTNLSIAWNGDCTFCCFDYDVVQKIGNINEDSLKEIWEGSRARLLRAQLRLGRFDNLPFCKDCPGPS